MLWRMSDAPESKPKPTSETEPDIVEAEIVEDEKAVAVADPAATQELAPEDRPAVAATAAASDRQVVYVHAPVPPKVLHNRLFGALIALLGTLVFGLAYLAVAAGVLTLTGLFDATVLEFLNTSAFWVPIL